MISEDDLIIEPQYPLPEQLRNLPQDDAVCKYCGIPYLIHSEMSKWKKRVAAVETAYVEHQQCKDLELKHRQEVQKLNKQVQEIERTNEELENELKSYRKASTQMKMQISQLRQDLISDKERYRANFSSFNTRLNQAVKDVKRKCHEALDIARANESDQRQLVITAESTVSEYRDKLSLLQEESNIKILKLRQQLDQVTSLKVISETTITEQADTINTLQKQLHEKTQASNKSVESYEIRTKKIEEELRVQLSVINELQRTLDAERSAHQSQISDLQKHFKTTFEERLAEKLKIIEQAQQAKFELKAMHVTNVLRAELQKAHSCELQTKNTEIKDLRRAVTKLEVELKTLKYSNERAKTDRTQELDQLRNSHEQVVRELQEKAKQQVSEIQILKGIVKKECAERNALLDRLKLYESKR